VDSGLREAAKPSGYYSYLLRLWREGEKMGWRASLHDPHTGERLGFASIDELAGHLRKLTETAPGIGESREVNQRSG
jgi:hypothetical protein